MIKPIDEFLGINHVSKKVNGCNFALTSYSRNAGFEDWHVHQNASISFLLNGTHEEDLFGKKHTRVPGDLKFIPAGEIHRCSQYSDDTRKINLDFNADFMGRMHNTEEQLIITIPQFFSTKLTLIKLYHDLADPSDNALASAELLLYGIFNPQSKAVIKAGKTIPQWVERLRELLNDEWNQPIHLTDLSIRLGVHPVTISRYFPVYFSSTLSNYLNDIKVDKALQLLKNTSLSLTVIAYTCGFADQAHFTRTFKSVTGYLPKTFRKL